MWAGTTTESTKPSSPRRVTVAERIGFPAPGPSTWPTIDATQFIPRPFARVRRGVIAGLAIALSLPPFGYWPLGVLGLAILAARLRQQPARGRAALGAGTGLGQYAVGLWWVNDFNIAGYLVLVAMGVALTSLAVAAVPARRRFGVLVGLPAALILSDWFRGHFPFGGLPIAGLALGQAAGPLAPVARIGGTLLVTGATALAGVALALATAPPVLPAPPPAPARTGRRRPWFPLQRGPGHGRPIGRTPLFGPGHGPRAEPGDVMAGGAALAVVLLLVAGGRLGPDGSDGRALPSIRVAAVQGGGPRGIRAVATDPGAPFLRQIQAGAALQPPLDLVVWPEDTVQPQPPAGPAGPGGQQLAQSPEATALGELAVRVGATVVAGVVDNVGPDRFRNAAVAWAPSGSIVARYDKAHRVPFGEYIPGRDLIRHLANVDLVPRDAIAGHGTGILPTPAGPLATAISYEVFFEDRARAAVRAGGQVLVVPTNASSYRTSQVPAQEVAAAQLRAWETGRDVVQAAPTGYSALIDHDGRITARSTLGRQQVVAGTLTRRDGRTLFVRLGDLPLLLLAAAGLIATTGAGPPSQVASFPSPSTS